MAQILELSSAEMEVVRALLDLPPDQFRATMELLRQARDSQLLAAEAIQLPQVSAHLRSKEAIERIIRTVEEMLERRLDDLQRTLEPQLRTTAAARGLDWDLLDEDTKDALIAEIIQQDG